MLAIILIYDQLLFRPLVAWSDKFRVELSAGGEAPRSWLLDMVRRARMFRRIFLPITRFVSAVPRQRMALPVAPPACGHVGLAECLG